MKALKIFTTLFAFLVLIAMFIAIAPVYNLYLIGWFTVCTAIACTYLTFVLKTKTWGQYDRFQASVPGNFFVFMTCSAIGLTFGWIGTYWLCGLAAVPFLWQVYYLFHFRNKINRK